MQEYILMTLLILMEDDYITNKKNRDDYNKIFIRQLFLP